MARLPTLLFLVVLFALSTSSFGSDSANKGESNQVSSWNLGCEIEKFGSINRPVAFIEVDGVRYGLNSPGSMKYGAAWDYGVVRREGGAAQRFLSEALKLCD